MSFNEFQQNFQQKFIAISAEKFKFTLHSFKVAVNISYALAHKQFYIINPYPGVFLPATRFYSMRSENKKKHLRIPCIQRRHWVSLWNFWQVDWRFEWLLFFCFWMKISGICLSFDAFHSYASERSYRLLYSAFCFNTLFRYIYATTEATNETRISLPRQRRDFEFIYQHHLRQCNKNVMKILLHIT